MKEAGFTVIRVGEGSWSKWEPEDDQFHLDWLQVILDKAHDYNIKVSYQSIRTLDCKANPSLITLYT